MTNDTKNLPDVNQNGIDDTATFWKMTVGLLPIAGPIFSEIIGSLIPNQRMDRISEFLRILDERLETLGHDMETLKEKMTEESYINLFEEGAWQAARASSTERKEYIANLLVNGLKDEVLDELQKGVFLKILSELNDVEILILKIYTLTQGNYFWEFLELHRDIVMPRITYGGHNGDNIDETLYKTYRDKLVRLNLLNYESPNKDDTIVFNQTGTMTSRGYGSTSLGRLFMQYIGSEDTF